MQRGERRLAAAAAGPTVAHIGPQHGGQQKAGRNGFTFTHAAVGVGQGGVDKRGVGTLHHHVQQRVDAGGHAQFFQLLDGGEGVAGLQQLEHFVKQAALRHIGQQRLRLHQRCGGLGVECETQRAQFGRKTHGADDPHRVFAVTHRRVANHAQRAFFGVLDTLVVVHHHLRFGVVVHGVDGEVAAHGVFFHRAPDVVAQHAAGGVHGMVHACQFTLAGFLVACHLFGRGVVEVGAEGGDLDHLVFTPPAVHHVHDAKAPPDDEGTAEQAFDLFWRGVGGHVEVFGAQTHQQVAHRAAHDVGLETCLLERAHHVGCPPVHQLGVDAMHIGADLFAFAERRLLAATGTARGLAQQLVDEFFDHGLKISNMRQPRSCASARRRSSGLVATGWSTFSSSAMSFMESV